MERKLYPNQLTNRLNITNIVFFSVCALVTLVGLPWYVLKIGISHSEWVLFFIFVLATGLSITVGYHRLLAHRAFQAHPVITFLSLFFGAAAFEQSALMWTSQHRDHHQYVDTKRDPYNIKQGFWYAHIGWMLYLRHDPDYTNVKDLSANTLIRHQHRYYGLWAFVSGFALPLAIGAATGHLLGAFLLSVAARITLVHHSTFSINSVCHSFGRATYDLSATARDHWLVALLTNGEGYHNFHHRFPSDYRNGVRWYHWDPSKWIIVSLNLCGLTKKLHAASAHAILSAKSAAENKRVENALKRRSGKDITALLVTLRENYTKLKTALQEWELSEQEYVRVRSLVTSKSRIYIQTLKNRLEEKRRAIIDARRSWKHFINTHPLIPSVVHV